MTSKSKVNFQQINSNLNLYSKLKQGTSKLTSPQIESLFHSNNLRCKNGKIISNAELNLNNKKNTNFNNEAIANHTNVNNNYINNLTNNYNPNSNSNSFRQAGILQKKYKTSKNSRIYYIYQLNIILLYSQNFV